MNSILKGGPSEQELREERLSLCRNQSDVGERSWLIGHTCNSISHATFSSSEATYHPKDRHSKHHRYPSTKSTVWLEYPLHP